MLMMSLTGFSALPYQSVLPEVGQEYKVTKYELQPSEYNPGPGGTGQNWIANLGTKIESFTALVEDASTSPYYSSFSDADFVVTNDYVGASEISGTNLHHHFYIEDNDKMIRIGRVDIDTISGDEYQTDYTDFEILNGSLMYYNFQHNDRWEAGYQIPNTSIFVSLDNGSNNYIVDASGSLTIDAININQIYRIKRAHKYFEFVPGQPVVEYVTESYEWWRSDLAFPLYVVEHQTSSDSVFDKYYAYKLDKSHFMSLGTEEVTPETFTFSVFPNPTAGELSVRLDLQNEAFVDIVLCDVSGREILKMYSSNTTGGLLKLDKNLNIPSGYYLIKIQVDGKSISKSLVLT